MEVLAVPSRGLARAQLTTLSLHPQRPESPPHVGVGLLVETLRRVPRAEVVAPSDQHLVEVGDHRAEIRGVWLWS